MAKKSYDGSISYLRKDIDWGVGDASATEGLPLSGGTVQQYIKDNFDHKAGYFQTRSDKGKCYVFASEADCSTYWSDVSTYADLLLGEFNAINEYMATISVVSPSSKSQTIFTSTLESQKINYIWDIVHKDSGASQDETVKCTYTISRSGYTTTDTVFYTATQKDVELDVTSYLKDSDGNYVEGETTINIFIEGQTHQVSTSTTVIYTIVNFSFSNSGYDVSKIYSASDSVQVQWAAVGTGSKTLYVFLDGDRITKRGIGNIDTNDTETISCAGLADGRHNIIMYASITFDGGATYYFSDVICRDFIVYSGNTTNSIIATMVDIPSKYLTITDNDTKRTDCHPIQIYNAQQYVQYKLVLGAWSPTGITTVNIKLDDTIIQSNLTIEKEKETTIYFTSDSYGTKTISIIATDGISYNIPVVVSESDIDVEELHSKNIELFFSGDGMSNDSSTKDVWTYANPEIAGSPLYTATFDGFNWNSASGWVNNGLMINDGATLSFNFQPFKNMQNGKTFEIELETQNVSDDDTIICDMSVGTTTRFMLKANCATLISSSGVNLTNKFKSEERVRISFVINPAGSTNEKLVFVYVNGIRSGGAFFGSSNYTIASDLAIKGSEYAQVWIKQIRVYNIALTADEVLNNYIRYRDTSEEMTSIYDKNNIIDAGTFSKDLMLKNLKLPVMTVIGMKDGISAVNWLDTKAGKSDQVDVNVLFENPWDPETSFYAEHITMTPQGTSSMVYPKRNYRLYTAYSKLLDPDEFIMWYTHGYSSDSSANWTEIPIKGKVTAEKDKRKRQYVFKEGTQPAVRWTIKADFAESSGTHNTGIARLWNNVMRNASVTYSQSPLYYKKSNGSYISIEYNEIISEGGTDDDISEVSAIPSPVLETSPKYIKILGSKSISNKTACETYAQECARTSGYEDTVGDVRTTVDGYPIAMFYQETESSPLVFMGKYNFNNDKSSESIFGFTDIPAFDEAFNGYYKPGTGHGFYEVCTDTSSEDAETYADSMQCWELTNSGDKIALYIEKPAGGASTDFRSGFEERYPGNDGTAEEVTRFNTYVINFANWMVDMRNDSSILRKDPTAETSKTYSTYTERDSDYYETYVKDKSELHDISFWNDDEAMAEAGYTLYSEHLTDEDVANFPAIEKLIQYKTEGSDVITVQFIKKDEVLYEQAVLTESNPIVSWINSSRFKDEKWDHFDVFKIAAYYIYLIRFGAVDQTVKNAMFTSEDGRHWYYINYDNDTVLGVRNDGRLMYDPDITRQTWDSGISDYAYAGYESTLWNCLEHDEEFMSEVVPAVDDALYKAGLTYAGTTTEMNTNQCDKWCEKIYNQDSQYKYVDSYVQDKKNYLDSMQGSRRTHRNWWISKRFNFYDAKFANTNYTGNYIYFLAPGVQETSKFKIIAGNNTFYSIGVNNRMITDQDGTSLPIELAVDSSFEFRCPNWTLQVGSPVNIYSAANIKELDFSASYGSNISQINFTGAYTAENPIKMERLILNGSSPNNAYSGGTAIVGLSYLEKLKYLDMKNIKGTSSAPVTEVEGISDLKYLETFISTGSNIQIIKFATGAPIKVARLSDKTTSITFNELSNLNWSGLVFGSGLIKDMSNLSTINISKCPNLSNNFGKIYNWYSNKTTSALKAESSLTMDNIVWTSVSVSQLKDLGSIITAGGTLNLTGKITVKDALTLEDVYELEALFGENCFNANNSLYITDETSVFIVGPSTVIEGKSAQYSYVALTGTISDNPWSVDAERDDFEINAETGLLTSREDGLADLSFNVVLSYTDKRGKASTVKLPVVLAATIYPTIDQVSITGPASSSSSEEKYIISYPSNVTGKVNVEWEIEGFDDAIGIKGSNTDSSVVLTVVDTIETVVSGKLKALVSNSYTEPSDIGTVSKDLTFINEDVLVIKDTNEPLFNLITDLGWITSHPTYFLKSEANAATDASVAALLNLLKTNDTHRTSLISFNEFAEFTNIDNLPTGAFYYEDNPSSTSAYALKEITLPENITAVPTNCFRFCTNLTKLVIPTWVETIKSYAFYGCDALVDIEFKSNDYLKTLESYAFYTCPHLPELNLPDSVETLNSYSVSNLYSLTSFKVPKATTSIANPRGLLQSCTSLVTVTVDPDNTTYTSTNAAGVECNAIMSKDHTILYKGIKGAIISDGLTRIEDGAFYATNFEGNGDNNALILPDSITYIGQYAFASVSIESIKFPSSLTTIETNVFFGSPLTTLDIPDTIETVKDNAFFACSTKYLTVGKNLTTIEGSGFGGMSKLETITVDKNNTIFCDSGTVDGVSYSNVLYDNINKILYAIAGNPVNDLVFPPDMKQTTSYLLYQRASEQDTVVDLSNTVLETVAFSTFAFMYNLEELYLPSTVTVLGGNIAWNDSKLRKIVIEAATAPDAQDTTWGLAGTYSESGNELYLPAGYSGYDKNAWTARLLNSNPSSGVNFIIKELAI